MTEIDRLRDALRSEFRDFLNSPEALIIIDQRVEMKIQSLNPTSQLLTRKQMAQMYQVSEQTIDRLTEEEL